MCIIFEIYYFLPKNSIFDLFSKKAKDKEKKNKIQTISKYALNIFKINYNIFKI